MIDTSVLGERTITMTATALGGSSITSEEKTFKIVCSALTPPFTSDQIVPLDKGADPSSFIYLGA